MTDYHYIVGRWKALESTFMYLTNENRGQLKEYTHVLQNRILKDEV